MLECLAIRPSPLCIDVKAPRHPVAFYYIRITYEWNGHEDSSADSVSKATSNQGKGNAWQVQYQSLIYF